MINITDIICGCQSRLKSKIKITKNGATGVGKKIKFSINKQKKNQKKPNSNVKSTGLSNEGKWFLKREKYKPLGIPDV